MHVAFLQTSKQVVVAFRTEEYRNAVIHNIDATHTCIEIGCHEGGSWQPTPGQSGKGAHECFATAIQSCREVRK